MDIEFDNVKLRLPHSESDLFRIPRLKISAGEKIMIYGPSGRGKTTLLHLMAGLLAPSQGQVMVAKKKLADLAEVDRARFRRDHFGLIFQRLNLIEHLTAEENVRLASVNCSREKAVEALAKVGLSNRAQTRSSVLSLGEQQRVAVARVLATRPAIVLADEPTSSLDEANANRVLDLLFDAAGDGTLVIVSHDRRIASRFSTTYDFETWVGS